MSQLDPKVILNAIPEHIEKPTIKHVKQRLRGIIYAFQTGGKIRDAPDLE